MRQCIISSRYYAKVHCVLVFIDIDNKPAFTAEIYENNKIGQFQGDQHDFRNIVKPTEEVKQLLKDFLTMYEIM